MDIPDLLVNLSFGRLKFQILDEDVEVTGVTAVIAAITGEIIPATRVTEFYGVAFIGGQ